MVAFFIINNRSLLINRPQAISSLALPPLSIAHSSSSTATTHSRLLLLSSLDNRLSVSASREHSRSVPRSGPCGWEACVPPLRCLIRQH
ncbi:hypothetical protein L6452_05465 [Arctium lappa]|uniref:Uncharacterized protein n=1 Tax=Arctium lappa TaxID=4217 RepID=A0ACB9EGN9_ARCLA|nr:hypothetical protein L6452_05465 [Arctium lappa]